MTPPLYAAALLTAMMLAAAPIHSAEAPPAVSDADRVAAFLLRSESGAPSFTSEGTNEEVLKAVASSWAAKSQPRRVAELASVAVPGSSGEARLVAALSRWTGSGRIAASREKDAAVAFLEDAASQAAALLSDPRVRSEVDAALSASGPDGRAAVDRARRMRERGLGAAAGVFGPDRDPGTIGGGSTAGSSAGKADPAGTSAAAFRPPVPDRLKKANVVPPLYTTDLTTSDRVINNVLSVVNAEAYSRKGTINRESSEGTQASICKYLIQANYEPGEAWSQALAARNVRGADPGDLDLRNAEHYLYAYMTTAKPSGWGDSTPVQLLMAVGWTPFKTVTKHVRPTSRPSLEEAKWGIKGAWHGQHPPDWRKTCEGAKY